MDLDNPGLAAAKLVFDSVDLFPIHFGREIDRSLLPAMTIAAMRHSGTAGEVHLADGAANDVADRLCGCLRDVDEGELRLLLAEAASGEDVSTEGPFKDLAGRPDLVLAAALVHDAVKAASDADYEPMTDAVAFLSESFDGYRPSEAASPVMAF